MSFARRWRNFSIGLVCAAALVAAGWEASSLISTPDEAKVAKATDPRITAEVTTGSLESQTTGTGTVKAGKTVEVTASAPDGRRPVVSAKPLAKGDAIRWCAPIVEVAGRPIIALQGVVPAYRDLVSGDSGKDVEQLQEALADCGIYRGKVDGNFGSATEQAVSVLYRNAGYDTETEVQEEDTATVPTSATSDGTTGSGSSVRSIITVPASELLFLPERGTIRSIAGIGTTPTDSPVATISLSGNVAELSIDPLAATKLHAGSAVTITIGDNDPVRAKLPALPEAPNQEEGADPAYIVDVPLPQSAHGAVAGADASYVIQVGSKKTYGAVVPTTALYEATDGSSFVLRLAGDESVTLPVTVIETAGGFAAVSDAEDSLKAGDRVVVGANR